MADLVLALAQSRVRIHTFAEGLFSRLAHDLELACGELSGTASFDGKSGTASIEAPLHGISVAGTVDKDGRVNERGLNPNEQRDCIAKMHHDVFHARPDDVVRLAVHLDGDRARVRIVPPNGRAIEEEISPKLHREESGSVRASGAFDISLMAIGSDVVKAPLNAFRVKDKVRVLFDVLFEAPAAG